MPAREEGQGRGIAVLPRPAVELEVVIPAFNEERRIGRTIKAVRAYLERQPYTSAVAVVDNGSFDRTVDVVAREAGPGPVPVHALNCARRGKGAAVREGILSSRATYVGFSDADLATPIETLDRVYPLLVSGISVVVASRKVEGAHYAQRQPALRRLGSSAFQLAARLLVPDVDDTQCGFKFFRRTVAQDLFRSLEVDNFAFDVELLAKAGAAGYEVVEVPVEWHDQPGSTFRALPDGTRALAELARFWWRFGRRGRKRGRPVL